MFGRARYVDGNPNDFEWRISEELSGTFELFIYQNLKRDIASLTAGVSMRATPRSGDEGRDIEIAHRAPVSLGGVAIFPPEGKSGLVFVECKSTSLDALDDSFLVDASQHRSSGCTAYVLVTNATISPYTHHRAVAEWASIGARFILLDRYRLLRMFQSFGWEARARQAGLLPIDETSAQVDRELSTAAQTKYAKFRGTEVVTAYLCARNYADREQRVDISLSSDMTWRTDAPQSDMILSPGEDRTIAVEFVRDRFDGNDDLKISVVHAAHAHEIAIRHATAQIALEPPFIGEGHRRVQMAIRSTIEAAAGDGRFISITGAAGVGKSRTIDEALRPLEGSEYDRFTLVCDPSTGSFDFAAFAADLAATKLHADGSPEIPDLTSVFGLLSELSGPVVLVLEDLHHLHSGGFSEIKRHFAGSEWARAGLSLVCSGRDDYTFPNTDYFSFLDYIRETADERCRHLAIESFSDSDAKLFINAVATSLPEPAVAHFLKVGQNNPFTLLEIMQYLLDVGLARLLSRRTIGVIDPERFAGALKLLPHAVEELIQRRLDALLSARNGEVAFEFLCAAALHGVDIDDRFAGAFFGSSSDAAVEQLLSERRFLSRGMGTNAWRFSHENFFHYLSRWIRTAAGLPWIERLTRRKHLVLVLAEFSRAELLSLAARHDDAFALFEPIWRRVQAVTNFSSEEIDRSYYRYLPALFESARQTTNTQSDLIKTPCVMGYMAVHNFTLAEGERGCAAAQSMLDELPPGGEVDIARLTIRQLRAHALQNMGRTGEALRLMLEIEGELKEGLIAPAYVRYDLYDRLQEYYRKANHAAMQRHYGRLAHAAVQESGDEKLLASHLITQSLVSLYRGRSRAAKDGARSLDVSEMAGVRRFVVFNQLTALVGQAIYAADDRRGLVDVYHSARALLREAAREAFPDSIVRLQLLLATLSPHVYDSPPEGAVHARRYISAGHESSLRFGLGLFDWAFHNLSAVLNETEGDQPTETARSHFQACVDRLQRRGLTFIGAADGTYPNVLAISNVVKFLARFRESDAVAFLQTNLTAYDARSLGDADQALELVRLARKGTALFWPTRGAKGLRLPSQGGYFTPVY